MVDEIITLYKMGYAIEEIAKTVRVEETKVFEVLEENNML